MTQLPESPPRLAGRPASLVLVGYRATGKSTVARLVALRLSWDWVDLDVEVELAAGKSIKQIFDLAGEPAFRDYESEALEQVCRRERTVVASGGGVILREENRRSLRRMGGTVWLRARPETIWQRVSTDPATGSQRPNLTTGGGLEEIVALLSRRESLYAECADVAFDTDERTPDQLADLIQEWLGDAG